MWLWADEMRALGFRRRAERFWRCERRYGLAGPDHLSVFPWGEVRLPGGRRLVELTEFHVTYFLAGERLHFYYHEHGPGEWRPGGHTSVGEIARAGGDAEALRGRADATAASLAAALGGLLAAAEHLAD
jgi:hypothetical protein